MSSSSSDLVEAAAMAADCQHHHLPEEITIEILSRLTVKSLLRFKCVCKNWCALISKPSFIAKHSTQTNTLNASTKHLFIIFVTYRDTIPEFAFSILFRNKQQQRQILDSASSIDIDFPLPGFSDVHTRFMLNVVGSCNGLVCGKLLGRDMGTKLVLWNPATRELRDLPEPGLSIPPQGEHNDTHYFRLGFGFDPYTNDFKLVRVLCFTGIPPPTLQAEVYSKITDSWREFDTELQRCVITRSKYAAVGRGIHWMGKGCNTNDNLIVCFDMGKEVFQKMPLPDFSSECCGEIGNIIREVGVVDDSLAFFLFPALGDLNSSCIDVWVMKEYGVTESWTKQLRIGPSSIRTMWMTCGEIILENREGEVLLYNPNTQTFEKLHESRDKFICGIESYMESLCSVKGGY